MSECEPVAAREAHIKAWETEKTRAYIVATMKRSYKDKDVEANALLLGSTFRFPGER